MKIVIFIVKIFIVLLTGILILNKLKTWDTSAFHEKILTKSKMLPRLFSLRQAKQTEAYLKKLSIPYNTFTIVALLGIGIISFLAIYAVARFVLPLKSTAYIVSFPFLFAGFVLIKIFAEKEQEKLESGLGDFFIQLKTALNTNPDIIEALRKIQNSILMPFSRYTKQMLNEINMGKLPESALEDFAQKIDIKKFSFYINNVRYCHIYGGNITLLTEKTQEVIADALKQKKKRNKETKSACIVLYALIVIDCYIYFSFIGSNPYYLNIMTNTFIGQVIVNVNFICIWGMIWLSKAIKKLDY